MQRWLLVSLLSLCTWYACTDFPEQTEHGYAFRYHRQSDGPKAQFGDELYVQFKIRTREQLLFESPGGPRGMRTVLQDPTLNPIKDPDPIADVLPLLAVGDSVTVQMPVTDDMRNAFGLETATAILYEVCLRRIVGKYEAEIAAAGISQEPDFSEEEVEAYAAEVAARLAVIPLAQVALDTLLDFMVQSEVETIRSSGLLYQLLDRGEESTLADDGTVRIRHIGIRSDGLIVSESFSGAPFTFQPGANQVIRAWEEAVSLIGPGGKLLLGTPPKLAYGAMGKAPYVGPNDTLYYYFERLK